MAGPDRRLAWITGAGGLIGNYIAQTPPAVEPGWEVIGWTRPALDLTDFAAVERAFRNRPPQLIIHCAALSRSPACQADPALARRQNVEVTRQLAALASDIPFIFFSTDLVFDGRQGNYSETAAVNPLSVYAETKVEAEQIALANPAHSVVRTSLNGGTSPTGDRGFNEDLRCAWQAGKTVTLFTDEFRSPIPAVMTARAVWELAVEHRSGLYHIAGSERLSRWQIGELIAKRWPHARIRPGSLRGYQGAPRPPDTSLDCSKVQKLLSFPLPGLSGWLKQNESEPF